MPRVSNLSNISPGSGSVFVGDNGTSTGAFSRDSVCADVIENYSGSTLAGSTQSVKAAINGLKAMVSALSTSTTAAFTAAEMTDTSKIYVYTGTNTTSSANYLLQLNPTGSTVNGITYEYLGDSQWRVYGTATKLSFRNLYANSSELPSFITPGHTYYLGMQGGTVPVRVYINYSDGTSTTTLTFDESGSFTVPPNATGMTMRINVGADTTIEDTTLTYILSDYYAYGNWYYYNGVEWVSGGVFNASVVDDTLSAFSTNAVENRAVAEAVEGLQIDIASATDMISAALKPEMVLHTEFDWVQGGYWNSSGGMMSTSLYHSGLIPIIPGGRHYLGYLNTRNSTVGAFFDQNGAWISTLMTEDVVIYPVRTDAADTDSNSYMTPNGNGGTSSYVSLYYFNAPANAWYFSYNLSQATDNIYRQYISSKPVFILRDSGNFVCRPGDALYQTKKDKKLCIIGPSTVMIDRWARSANDTPYVVGFQEYLSPWYEKVDSYGFSGGAWYREDNEDATSIYNGIVTNQVDLSGYDEFLLLPSTNGLTLEIVSDWNSTNTSMYFGAMNATIEYIYSQVPLAKIYLVDMAHRENYYQYSITKEKQDAVNTGLVTLATERSYELIQVSKNSGFNAFTSGSYTYDGIHYNSLGSRVYGRCLRKYMLGF